MASVRSGNRPGARVVPQVMSMLATQPLPRLAPFPSLRPAPKRGWLERMLRVPRPDLAMQALKALFARREPSEVSSPQISDLILRYGVAGPQARELLVGLWQQVLAAFLADNALSNAEIVYLEALRRTLTLTPAEADEAKRTVIHPRYEVAVGAALADRQVSAAEREALARLATELQLPAEVERDIFERSAKRTVDALVRDAAADRRLSPEEREELALVARHLGVEVGLDEATEALLDRFALFWSIENGDLPTVAPTLALDYGELCYFTSDGAWHRPLGWGRHGDRGDSVMNVRVARGVYYRSGSASDESLLDGRTKKMDRGRVSITSRRIVFEGTQGTIRRGLRSIDSFCVYRDGLILEKATGRGLYLTIDDDVELAAVILGAALSRA